MSRYSGAPARRSLWETKAAPVGFGTVNGRDGKPFMTRDGGVPRLENLIHDIDEEMFRKIVESRQETGKRKQGILRKSSDWQPSNTGDLSNQAAGD